MINEDALYGVDLEISIAYDFYKFNIAIYNEEKDTEDNLINLRILHYINNNENKNICIFTLLNNNQYNLDFYKKILKQLI